VTTVGDKASGEVVQVRDGGILKLVEARNIVVSLREGGTGITGGHIGVAKGGVNCKTEEDLVVDVNVLF
jgi:hypothetical protein